ncbi:MAG: Ig-like domain-containing protein [Cyclobacteriaceae bacterium]|jgi:hypothetical protein|nr:Ig-like domain-containing protein [Cyclobacteriaceae bacterium]
MLKQVFAVVAWLVLAVCVSCKSDESQEPESSLLQLVSLRVGADEVYPSTDNELGVLVNRPIVAVFDRPIQVNNVARHVALKSESGTVVETEISFLDQNSTLSLRLVNGTLANNTTYTLEILPSLRGQQGESFAGAVFSFRTIPPDLRIVSTTWDGAAPVAGRRLVDVSVTPEIIIGFETALLESSLTGAIELRSNNRNIGVSWMTMEGGKVLKIVPNEPLRSLDRFTLTLKSTLTGRANEVFQGLRQVFYTRPSNQPHFPPLSDTDLLTLVQRQTFKYFFDFAHPASGMARERNTSGDLVTTGGSGFGVMALIVGMERGFITRAQGLQRLDRILDFLETCDRFHGAWPHWMNGNTGKTIPFSTNDNGADLVETSFMIQGLLTMRQYLQPADATEQAMINRINALWQAVEWDWFTRGGQNVLYWHWSPDRGWAMNMTISGYNESLITYVLAAASPTHAIAPAVYTQGWARNGAIRNNRSFYNITLPVGYDYGGPLFFAHYSFLGLDPRGLSDTYANYWQQNVNHSLINRAYCIANPRNFVAYSDACWGLTASDNHVGYSAHSPTNDLGVIAPTAALSSFPFTPTESMDALKFFYYTMGDRLWGEYGFYDAFNITEGWVANSYLAIDQGPIVVMIENYRTGLLWDLFMSAPEVHSGLTTLGFTTSN